MKNIAILGSAFNPITKGHTGIAENVIKTLPFIDEVRLSPCYRHSFGKQLENDFHRLEMCKLAVDNLNNPKIKLSDYEIKNKLSGTTYDFFSNLNLYPEFLGNKYFFIMGLDNAVNIHKFYKYEELLKIITFITINRDGVETNPENDWYKKAPHIYFELQKDSLLKISSTQVRDALLEDDNETLAKMIDKDVLDYIKLNHLFGYKHGN